MNFSISLKTSSFLIGKRSRFLFRLASRLYAIERESAALIFSIAASRPPLKGIGAEYCFLTLSKWTPRFNWLDASRCIFERSSKSSWGMKSSLKALLTTSWREASSTFSQLHMAEFPPFFPPCPSSVQPNLEFIAIGSCSFFDPSLTSPPQNAAAWAAPRTRSTFPSASSKTTPSR